MEKLKKLKKHEKLKEAPEAKAEEAQEVPTPVDSRRIAPKFDEFPDEKLENHGMKMKKMFLHEQVQSWTK